MCVSGRASSVCASRLAILQKRDVKRVRKSSILTCEKARNDENERRRGEPVEDVIDRAYPGHRLGVAADIIQLANVVRAELAG